MGKRVLIIGGYGNFGSYIARRLSKESDITVIVAGRSSKRAQAFANTHSVEWAVLDINADLETSLADIRPDIVIHTSGPYQKQDHSVAEACIKQKCHYIDLADAREFVANIGRLDAAAKRVGISVISGASSVPCLTSAIIDRYIGEFKKLEAVTYGIATAQKTNLGLATTSAVLSYAGKPIETLVNGKKRNVFGWQNLHFHKFEDLGWRALGNCDVPDLELFPARYPELKTIRFYAGVEVPILHFGLWFLSWLVRIHLLPSLDKVSKQLLDGSRLFDSFGSDKSGFFMELSGKGEAENHKKLTFDLTAKSGDGPFIPCTPAIILALRLARGDMTKSGAIPCVGFLELHALLKELEPLDISWKVQRSNYEG